MKQQIFIDDIYEYDYELSDDNLHTLYYSNGDIALKVFEDRKRIQFNIMNILSYEQSKELSILLKIITNLGKINLI
jgi:hypothetical protein